MVLLLVLLLALLLALLLELLLLVAVVVVVVVSDGGGGMVAKLSLGIPHLFLACIVVGRDTCFLKLCCHVRRRVTPAG